MCVMTLYVCDDPVLPSVGVTSGESGQVRAGQCRGQWPGYEVEQRIAAILLHKPGLILSGYWVHLHNLSTGDPADS